MKRGFLFGTKLHTAGTSCEKCVLFQVTPKRERRLICFIYKTWPLKVAGLYIRKTIREGGEAEKTGKKKGLEKNLQALKR